MFPALVILAVAFSFSSALLVDPPVFKNCLTPAQAAASPIFVDPATIRISDNSIIFGRNLTLIGDVNLDAAVISSFDRNFLHLSLDAGRLGSLAGANFEGDLCEAMDYFKSPQKCPFSGGFYPGLIFSQYPIPKIPGAGIFIKRVDITLKIFKMIDGVKTPESPLWACFGATVPVRSSL